MNKKNGAKIGIVILSIAALVMVIAAVLVVLNSRKTNESSENASNNQAETGENSANSSTEAIKSDDIYTSYIKNELAPAYGAIDTKNDIVGEMYEPSDEWLNVSGIISTYIEDINNDSVDELLVFRIEDTREKEARFVVKVGVYTIINDAVTKLDEQELKPFCDEFEMYPVNYYAAENSTSLLSVSSVVVDDETYILCERPLKADAFADGVMSNYWALKLEGDKLNVAYSLTQPYAGSSGLEYYGYDLENGSVKKLEILIGYDDDMNDIGKYTEYNDALVGFFADHGVMVTDYENAYDHSIFAENLEVHNIFTIRVSHSMDYTVKPFIFTFHVEDSTGANAIINSN